MKQLARGRQIVRRQFRREIDGHDLDALGWVTGLVEVDNGITRAAVLLSKAIRSPR